MAKSKNHTNHNQGEYLTSVTCVSVYFSELNSLWHIYFNLIHFFTLLGHKWHRNGIKKPKKQRFPSLKGVRLPMILSCYSTE